MRAHNANSVSLLLESIIDIADAQSEEDFIECDSNLRRFRVDGFERSFAIFLAQESAPGIDLKAWLQEPWGVMGEQLIIYANLWVDARVCDVWILDESGYVRAPSICDVLGRIVVF